VKKEGFWHLHPCPYAPNTRARTAWDIWARCKNEGIIVGPEPGTDFDRFPTDEAEGEDKEPNRKRRRRRLAPPRIYKFPRFDE